MMVSTAALGVQLPRPMTFSFCKLISKLTTLTVKLSSPLVTRASLIAELEPDLVVSFADISDGGRLCGQSLYLWQVLLPHSLQRGSLDTLDEQPVQLAINPQSAGLQSEGALPYYYVACGAPAPWLSLLDASCQ